MAHLARIDALRALAAMAVLVSHVGFWTGVTALDFSGGMVARGDVGVDIFFALSSFLLISPWLAESGDTLSDYAIKRTARILPAYWVVLAVVLLLGGAGVAEGGWGAALSHVVMTQGFTGADYQAFAQSWSLTSEVTFYLVVPLIGPRLLRAKRPLFVLAVVTVIGLTTHAIAHALPATAFSRALALSALGHAAWFAAGAAVIVLRNRRVEFPATSVLVLSAALLFLVASSPLAGPRDLHLSTWVEALTKETLYAALAFVLLVIATQPCEPRSSDGALRRMGDWSYGVFLWQLVVLQVLYTLTGMALFSGRFWWVLGVTVCFSVALAAASTWWVEQPAQRWARRHVTARGQQPTT